MTDAAISQALASWRSALGDDAARDDAGTLDRYARTTAAGDGARPAAVLLPTDTQQVQQIVKTAAAHGVPLYPISRGRNWGYGDATAPGAGQVVVDLSRMNRILEVNEQLGYAVIEAGVSQQAFHDHLAQHHPDLWVDVTGAGLDSSFVGNTLDHGFGHTRYGDHFASTCGMEVVLADGQVLETGYGHFANAKAARVYPYGIGPYLDGLFCQSNYGIVTRTGVWLMPRPRAFCAFFFAAKDDGDLARIVDRLRPLRMQGMLQSALHIGNDLRTFSARTRYPWDEAGGVTPLPRELRMKMRKQYGVGAWNGCGAIYGLPGMVKSVKRAVREALRGMRLHFIDDARLRLANRMQGVLGASKPGRGMRELLDIIEPIYGLLKGIPSNEPLAGMGWRVREGGRPEPRDPLELHAGLMWASPVVPTTGEAATELMRLIEPIYEKRGFEALVTFTMINERSMIAITNLSFDKREPKEAAAATRCYDELLDALFEQGFIPYRMGHASMHRLHREGDVFWDVARRIKGALDPKGIIAPGRYLPR